MNIWTAAVVIVAIIAISSMYTANRRTDKRNADTLYKALDERLNDLEKRMANLETIVLDQEHKKNFSGL